MRRILDIAALSASSFETLCENGEFILSRGVSNGEPLLVTAPASDRPAPATLARLAHAYALRDQLDPAWAARPHGRALYDGRQALISDDPGGELLARILGEPWELKKFFRVATGLAASLGGLHRRGLVHKDIKPSNVLVKPATGEVFLLGFGIASRLPRERQLLAPPQTLDGTLAYMAPEQTGRMNRSIDGRSDLYALGVTFYEMLTGGLPFTATDPMEWVHCHIARQPLPPSECVVGIPEPLSGVVMKLLAKTAEERYQTAAGVEVDLRRCLTAWESGRPIDSFRPGTQDASDRLRIPEKLYGREPEIDALAAAFGRVVAGGATELVLVPGYSGIGKSSVVNELHKVLVPPRGLFTAGKFDQYKRDIPYATLAQAFQNLVRQISGEGEASVNNWRAALQEALGPNGQLIIDLIPELELLIGKQPAVPELPPQDVQIRFQTTFRRFIAVFARPEHPLALFLDDLQWLDTGTLELLAHLATQREVRHLLLIGAYRDNEVGPSHPLARTVEEIRAAGTKVQEITLGPLTQDAVGRLLADALHSQPKRVQPLAQLVHEKTAGNPFFVIQFITALADEELLAFDPGPRAWRWNLDRIQAKDFTDNVLDLMAVKLNRLPRVTQEALKRFACLGNSAPTALLSVVQQTSEEELHAALWEAVRAEFVLRQEDAYAFFHDRVQEAAYSLIAEEDRAAAHLRIGKLLVSLTTAEEMDERIFEIVNQLNRGAALIDSPKERNQAAELNLRAGKRAKASAAYASALTYLAAGRALLAENDWDRRYRLKFDLEIHSAECEFLTGDLGAAEDRLALLSARAANPLDCATVTFLQVTLYTALDRSDRAIEICLQYMRHIGIDWSPHPAKDEAWREYGQILRRIESSSIEALKDLPKLCEPERAATLDVLTAVLPPAFFSDENLVSLVLCRMANLSLEYGNSDASSLGYAYLGMILGPYFGDYPAGFRFGKLGFDLVEQRGLERYKARVYMCFGYHVMPWTRHLRTGITLIRRAFDAAKEVGDLTYAGFSSCTLVTSLLGSGAQLGDLQQEAEARLDFVCAAKFGLISDIITAQLQLIRNLRGLTLDFGSFNNGEFDENQFEQHLEGNRSLAIAACWYWIRKLQARVYSTDFKAALEAASKAESLLWTSSGHFEMAEYHFYGGLARAAHYDAASPDERPQHLAALTLNHKQLQVWAENCPENFGHRAALIAGEVARVEGREQDAMRLYEQAIQLARDHGFVQNEALANEFAARFYAARNFATIADAYLRNARSAYMRWGAKGKVRQLDRLYPQVAYGQEPAWRMDTVATQLAHLDLATVVKISDALSGEISLPKLMETLMASVLEQAGAERGFLILAQGDELRVEAEATAGPDKVQVRLRPSVVTCSGLPTSVLNEVVRTRARVLLDDAQTANAFSNDPYLNHGDCRSVLCLPLAKQARLIGLLYLENNLAPHVFTEARLLVLNLLASQAATALQNAALEAKVESLLKEVDYRVNNN